jgi:hypothetical protein
MDRGCQIISLGGDKTVPCMLPGGNGGQFVIVARTLKLWPRKKYANVMRPEEAPRAARIELRGINRVEEPSRGQYILKLASIR